MSSCVRESSPQPEHAVSQKPGNFLFIFTYIVKNPTDGILK